MKRSWFVLPASLRDPNLHCFDRATKCDRQTDGRTPIDDSQHVKSVYADGYVNIDEQMLTKKLLTKSLTRPTF